MDWEKIRGHIVAKDVNIYYAGGTLCLDIRNRVVCLNLDGRATYFTGGDIIETQPKDVNIMVQRAYLKEKGDTDYFVEETLKAAVVYNGGS